jgi:predicted transcriptional regulator
MAAHPITLDPDLQEKLEARASRETRSPEMLLRDAVEQYLQREEDDALNRAFDSYPVITREQYLREGEEAYQHYKQTGLHLTHEEVDAWLEKLERGEDASLPPCHV